MTFQMLIISIQIIAAHSLLFNYQVKVCVLNDRLIDKVLASAGHVSPYYTLKSSV